MTAEGVRIPRIDGRRTDPRAALAALRTALSPRGNIVSDEGRRRTLEVFGRELSPQEVVATICEDVRTRGLAAVLDYSERLDKAQLTADTLQVSQPELAAAHAAADAGFLKTIRRVRDNILEFQRPLVPADIRITRPHGSYLAQRYLPLDRVGICVPGGAAAYPSTVLMTAVPAQAAGVGELAIVAPPTKFGSYNADLLATCHELGVREVYRMGGAQAVAALAFGIEGLPRVDKIVGPGNLFVALAKKYVYGEVDIDSIAGPSEVVVIADASTRADYTAADLIAQAEHAPGASILITWSEAVLNATADELRGRRRDLERGDLARQSLEQFGRWCWWPMPRKPPHWPTKSRRAFAHCHGRRRVAAAQDPPCRRDLPGQLLPGGAGRLRGRSVARATHRRHGPLCQRTLGAGLSAIQQCAEYFARGAGGAGRRCARIGGQGGADGTPGQR